jgi:polysaccharide pyruvyl transferase WcaK-like protein
LLDSYSGSNLGDAAILDATIAHLRRRIPGVMLTSITLNISNMERRHGISGAPLCCNDLPYYYMCWGDYARRKAADPANTASARVGLLRRSASTVKRWIKQNVPNAWIPRSLYARLSWGPREIKHFIHAYRFLRSHTLLVIAGGGQFDEEWGGPWGHPYALFKWTLAARLAGVPCAVASVGVCKLDRRWSRLFVRFVLRSASYRSYRDRQSRSIAASLVLSAGNDPVVPDLALGISANGVPESATGRPPFGGQRVIAISPIAYKRPQFWPSESRDTYSRYTAEMKSLLLKLIERDYRLLFFWSSTPDDQTALAEILAQFDADEQTLLRSHTATASIENWPDIVAALRDVHMVVASRLHSIVLSLVARVPVLAISFDSKVDRMMQELGHAAYLLDIHSFTSDQALTKLREIEAEMEGYRRDVTRFGEDAVACLDRQFDRLAMMAQPGREEGEKIALEDVARLQGTSIREE